MEKDCHRIGTHRGRARPRSQLLPRTPLVLDYPKARRHLVEQAKMVRERQVDCGEQKTIFRHEEVRLFRYPETLDDDSAKKPDFWAAP